MLARVWHAVVAGLVAIAVVLQVIIAIRQPGSPHVVDPGLVKGSSLLGRLIRVFSFFTVDSNILSGVVSAQLALRPDRDGPLWRVVRLMALFGITVTGLVYATVLAPIHDPAAGAETILNTIVHYLVPVLMVLGWLLFGPRPRITAGVVGRSLLYPVLWLGYTLIRGAIWRWYPYPFLDVPSHGYLTVLLNCVAVTAVFAVVAGLFAAGDRWLPPRPPGWAAAG